MNYKFTLIALVVAGCTGSGQAHPAGPPAVMTDAATSYQAAANGNVLYAGVIVGKVQTYDGKSFIPVANQTVNLGGTGLTATTGADGTFGFQQIAPGEIRLTAERDGFQKSTLTLRSGSVAGLARANLVLVPTARPSTLPSDAIIVAGTVTDPRGAALPGGTVHIVDSISNAGKGSNTNLQADADGFFAETLSGIRPGLDGQVQFTAYGVTPGGVSVETTAVLTAQLGGAPFIGLVVGTTVFTPVQGAFWIGGTGQSRAIHGLKMPQRRDELVLHFTQDARSIDVLPDTVTTDRCNFTMPQGFDPGRGTVELRTLGLVPAPSVDIGT